MKKGNLGSTCLRTELLTKDFALKLVNRFQRLKELLVCSTFAGKQKLSVRTYLTFSFANHQVESVKD